MGITPIKRLLSLINRILRGIPNRLSEVGRSIRIPSERLRSGMTIGVVQWIAINLFVAARMINKDIDLTIRRDGKAIMSGSVLSSLFAGLEYGLRGLYPG
jgi:hypothetical protein